MTVLFDTKMLAPQDRGELWGQACEQIFFPLAVAASGGDLASSRIERHPLGPVKLYRLASDHGRVQRTAAGIRAHDPETLLVATAVRGTCLIEQAGRQSAFSPGDVSSWDSSRPFRVTHFDPFDLLLLTMPATLLGARADAIRRQTAGCVPCGSPLGSVIGLFIQRIWQTLSTEGPSANQTDLADAVIALVRAVHTADPVSTSSVQKLSAASLMTNVKAYIDEHLGDPALGLESVARAHYVSTRYVQKLFAADGIPVSEWIRYRRLEACRRDLGDPARARDTIAEIAGRWALTNPAHFSRIFREAYGCTPSEFREQGKPVATGGVNSRQAGPPANELRTMSCSRCGGPDGT
jgi:AraC-like DNA-binding protein